MGFATAKSRAYAKTGIGSEGNSLFEATVS